MKKLNQKGFSPVYALLVLVILGLIVGVAYYVYNSQKKINTGTQSNVNPDATTPDNTSLNTYKDELANYTIQYPNNWKVSVSKKYSEYGQSELSTVTVTADTGLTLTLKHNFGGRGGDCQPRTTDVAHASENHCQTSETIFAEKTGHKVLGIDANVDPKLPERFKKYDIYLTRTKYTGEGSNSKTIYFSGLASNNYTGEVSVSEAQMGLFVPFTIVSHYSTPDLDVPVDTGYYIDVEMSPHGADTGFFDQEDVKQAEEILRSFQFNNL